MTSAIECELTAAILIESAFSQHQVGGDPRGYDFLWLDIEDDF